MATKEKIRGRIHTPTELQIARYATPILAFDALLIATMIATVSGELTDFYQPGVLLIFAAMAMIFLSAEFMSLTMLGYWMFPDQAGRNERLSRKSRALKTRKVIVFSWLFQAVAVFILLFRNILTAMVA